jgi:CBS domain containing-hemolysin-like protein
MLENPRRLLSSILLADAAINAPLLAGSLALIESHRHFDLPGWAVALLLLALIVFVCDLLPKLLALSAPKTVARLGVPVFARLTPLLDPVSRLLQNFAERVAEKILPKSMTTQRLLSEEEIETLVELSTEQGALHETESEMISEIIKLGDKTAHDCMTPRVDMFALPDDLSNEEAIAALRRQRFHRVPVYGETPDDIEGILDVAAFLRDPSEHFTERLEVPSFIPDTMKAMTLLKSFLKRPQNLAIVVDEHGGVEGVITMSDLVEEIISDAVPNTDAKLYLESIGSGVLLANGNARLEDIAEELGVEFEAEGVDTIGGLIFNELGHLPKQGQELAVGPVMATIRKVSRKRVEEVQIVTREDSDE